MALSKFLIRSALTGSILMASASGAYALAVFDAQNFAENLATKLKLAEELKYVIELYNQGKYLVQLAGQIQDMAKNFGTEPTRLINNIQACLNTDTNTAVLNLCGIRYNTENALFANFATGGALTDQKVTEVEEARRDRLKNAAKSAVALGEVVRRDAQASSNALIVLAGEAQAPQSQAGQANMTNKLLVQLASQIHTQNALMAGLLELQGAQALQLVPVSVGAATARVGVKTP